MDQAGLLHHRVDLGQVRFAGQRSLLLDAVAVGVLRTQLVDSLGFSGAMAALTRFGFVHGWRMAEGVDTVLNWDDDSDRLRGWLHLAALQGLMPTPHATTSDDRGHSDVTVGDSHEAAQHLLHFGLSDKAVCATICGIGSGYMSRCLNQDIRFLEDRCIARGDSACRLLGKPQKEWAADRADELMRYEGVCHDSLGAALRRATRSVEMSSGDKGHRQPRDLASSSEEGAVRHGIVARSEEMRQAVDLACRVAQVDATVLINGESGVGKERIAQLIHDRSTRAAEPFVAVNCGAITETLLESELFGHARGAFTGASQDRLGLFEAANRGTLLLDEVGEISAGLQVKLLRVLQEREVRRVGENRSRKIDVRVLAATNQDLSARIEAGLFRQDLYYRLKVVELPIPALRDRGVDILPLARVLLADAARRLDLDLEGFSLEVADLLLRYRWPGNVRELKNTMERAAALARGPRVEVEVLPDEIRYLERARRVSDDQVRPLRDVQKDYILAVLATNDGNQAKTAAQLQIGTATLYRKLKKWREQQSPSA